MRKSLLFVLAFVMLLAIPAAQAVAKDLKIGVVDVEYIIHTSTKGKGAKAKLKKS